MAIVYILICILTKSPLNFERLIGVIGLFLFDLDILAIFLKLNEKNKLKDTRFKKYCNRCKWFVTRFGSFGVLEDCWHPSNRTLLESHRNDKQCRINEAEDINKENNCKNYHKKWDLIGDEDDEFI